MNQVAQVTLENYTYAGDVAVMALCIVTAILVLTSYVSRTRAYRIFTNIVVMLFAAALTNIGWHWLLTANNPATYGLIYGMRILYQALLFDVFFLFALYTTEVSGLDHHQARIVAIVASLLFVVIIGIDVVRALTGNAYHVAESGMVIRRTSLYLIGYILFFVLLAMLLTRVRNLVYKRVMYGFYGTMALSFAIRIGQLFLNEASLTTMTFVFPVIAMLYIMHSNPYNITLGAVDVRAMEDQVRTLYVRKQPFLFVSLLLPDYDAEGKEIPEDIRAQLRRLSTSYFRNCVLFQIGKAHLILIAPKHRNADYEHRFQKLLKAFSDHYRHFRVPYKIVLGESIEEISRKNEYASLIRSINREIPENTVRRVSPDDIDRFNRGEYILRELTDIYNRRDLDDPRVLAYCQPVFNLRSGQFDTAEALMRLKLDQIGLVYPDQFIPLAESYGYIHVLTEIILHKTCREIHRLKEEGFRINRISVNVSVLELKDDAFCGDIEKIIGSNRVSGENVAIELTETGNEEDFMLMKEKIEELRAEGLQFYLDDFGTGYSNMERIMELPFDIIKFDRSMVIASGTDQRSEKIVENLAHMFKDMDYSVLYEGVEDEKDEERCREMSAAYLQGYKYSHPVPIEHLRNFLPKAG